MSPDSQIWPPRLLAKVIGRDITPTEADVAAAATAPAAYCALSGEFIPAGAPRRKFTPSKDTFTNWADVSGDTITLAAAILLEKPVMRITQKCVIAESGIYPASTFSNRSALLLDPPAGPLVWVHSTLGAIATQHLVWRAKVSPDPQSLIYICYGGENFSLRRRLILDAVQACKVVCEAHEQHAVEKAAADAAAAEAEGVKVKKKGRGRAKKKAAGATDMRHPFVKLDPSWQSDSHGVLRTNYVTAAIALGKTAELNLLRRLTSAEKWALMPLLYADKHPPLRPDPIAIPEAARLGRGGEDDVDSGE